MTWNSLRNLVAGIVLGVLLMACTAMSQGNDPVPALNDTAWVLAALPGTATPHAATPTLRFDTGRVQGSDGCNRFGAPYTGANGRLQISPNGFSTQMACPEPVSRLAASFNAALAKAQGYRIDGKTLLLLDAAGATLASFVAQGTELAGTAWQVTAYNNGKQAVVGVTTGSTITLEFIPEGRVRGSGGCNHFSGGYTSSADQLTIGPVGATRRACTEPEGVMAQETAFLRALESVASARREGDRLELRTATGALAVTMIPAPADTTAPASPPR